MNWIPVVPEIMLSARAHSGCFNGQIMFANMSNLHSGRPKSEGSSLEYQVPNQCARNARNAQSPDLKSDAVEPSGKVHCWGNSQGQSFLPVE